MPPALGVDRRPLFRDPSMQADFARNGYVVAPLLDRPALDRLAELWGEVRPGRIAGIWSNVHGTDTSVNDRVDALIRELVGPRVAELFDDCRVAGSTFLVKGTGAGSESKLHQDWNNVDESVATSVALWCPLEDVDEGNGALQVIPGSHRWFGKLRGLTTSSVYLEFDDRLEPFLRSLPVPAGTGVFYAHNLFHGSKDNRSDDDRVTVVAGILPREVDHVHYWQSPTCGEGRARELHVHDEFFRSGLAELAAGRVPGSAEDRGAVTGDTTPLTADEVLAAAGR